MPLLFFYSLLASLPLILLASPLSLSLSFWREVDLTNQISSIPSLCLINTAGHQPTHSSNYSLPLSLSLHNNNNNNNMHFN